MLSAPPFELIYRADRPLYIYFFVFFSLLLFYFIFLKRGYDRPDQLLSQSDWPEDDGPTTPSGQGANFTYLGDKWSCSEYLYGPSFSQVNSIIKQSIHLLKFIFLFFIFKCFDDRWAENITLGLIPGASHQVQQDAPDIVNRKIREFLQSS